MLIASQLFCHVPKLISLIADDYYIGMIYDCLNTAPHQLRDMRNLTLDVLLVGPDELCHRNMPVVESKFESFTDESFDQCYDR